MKATVTKFTKVREGRHSDAATVQVIGGSSQSIIYSVMNMFGFFEVEIEGRYNTDKKASIARRLAKPGNDLIKHFNL